MPTASPASPQAPVTSSGQLAHLALEPRAGPPRGVPEVWAPAAPPFLARQEPAPPVCVGTGRGGSKPKRAGPGESDSRALAPRSFAPGPTSVTSGVPLDTEARSRAHGAQTSFHLCVEKCDFPSKRNLSQATSCRMSSPMGCAVKFWGLVFPKL